ncbi:MAG: hypothetical protein WBF99_19050 [Xanthobacteraceae bacterium]|nr:hypothetical protein [Hyphomicrobiales bacterium]
MPKAACECNSLTASDANKPHEADFYRFPNSQRSVGDIQPNAAAAQTNPFKTLL